MNTVGREIRQILERHLSTEELSVLDGWTGHWQEVPFEWDDAVREVRVRDEWLWRVEDPGHSVVDVLCRAVEALNGALSPRLARLLAAPGGEQEFTFDFSFLPDIEGAERFDPEAADRFESALRLENVWNVHIDEYPDGKVFRVTIRFRSEEEYARQHDHLYWLFALAKRGAKTWKGTRL